MTAPGASPKGKAFLTGSVGCLVTFLVVGGIVALLGGTVFLDLGGAVLLLLIGGVIGLIVNAIYQRGRRDAIEKENDGSSGPIHPG